MIAAMTMAILVESSLAASDGKMFASPQEAVDAAVMAVRDNNEKEFIAVFGSEGEELFSSGDPVSDQEGRERFLKAYEEKNSLVAEGENMVLEVGKDAWPFPIPLVKSGEEWFFDTIQGKGEILNRRIGRNELDTIQTCLAYVDAQREYAMKDPDGDGKSEYAQKFVSDPGMKNGLYWKTEEGEERSPLGAIAAQASSEGYTRDKEAERTPYNGYFFKILTAQGDKASGGAYDYLVDGKMIGGFALIAYPAEYGNSGVMTFIVNYDGVVYQKDLGPDTKMIADQMDAYDPDASWQEAKTVIE